jgi:hypothetical protein
MLSRLAAAQRVASAGAGPDAPPLGALIWLTGGLSGWLPALALIALLAATAALIAFAVFDWRSYQRRGTRRGYRPRRSAHERFATSVEHQRRAVAEESAPPPAEPQPQDDEDELLRQLLGQ